MSRFCAKCLIEKPITEYGYRKERDSYYTHCKECRREAGRVYSMQHRHEQREYCIKNKESVTAYKKLWYAENRERLNIYRNDYRNKNKDKDKIYKLNTIKNNSDNALARNLRCRIRLALRKNIKSASLLELMGCDIPTFKKHIESKFLPGMTWENRGFYGWHIDHIKPCASFDLSIPEEQRRCFNYKNMQPLWAFDNISKGDKIIYKQAI